MTEPTLGNNIVTQTGIIVHDIESKARSWSEILDLPMLNIIITDTVEKTQAEYNGRHTTARAKLVFFHMRQLDVELMNPAHGKLKSVNTMIVCITLHSKLKACRKKLHIWIQKAFHFYRVGNILAGDMYILMASLNWEQFWNC
jgi:hypothetical protein